MKKLIPLFLLAMLFCGCSHNAKNYIVIKTIQDDKTICSSENSAVTTQVNASVNFSFYLLPYSDDYIDITNIYSSAPEVLLIESVNQYDHIIKAKALKTGTAQIHIFTKSYSNTSSPVIYVN